jgi:uncharacterized protein YcbX
LPEKDAVIILTSETNDLQGLLDLVWENLLPAFDASSDQDSALKDRLEVNLSLAPLQSESNSEMEKKINEKNYTLTSNVDKISAFSLNFQEGVCLLNYVQGPKYLQVDFWIW